MEGRSGISVLSRPGCPVDRAQRDGWTRRRGGHLCPRPGGRARAHGGGRRTGRPSHLPGRALLDRFRRGNRRGATEVPLYVENSRRIPSGQAGSGVEALVPLLGVEVGLVLVVHHHVAEDLPVDVAGAYDDPAVLVVREGDLTVAAADVDGGGLQVELVDAAVATDLD